MHNYHTQILAAKKKDPIADTSALEKQIDKMVYALYDLTEEEIAVVEGKGKTVNCNKESNHGNA